MAYVCRPSTLLDFKPKIEPCRPYCWLFICHNHTMLTASSNPIFMVIGTGLIGYSAARHILAQGEEEKYEIIILAGTIIAAEIAWLCRSWLIV